MDEKIENEKEEIKLELKAKTSKIKGQPGVVRIHEAHIEDVDFNKGDNIELCIPGREGKGIIVKVVSDRYILKGFASIRKGDMNKLKIDDNDPIILKSYKKYSESIKEGYEKLKTKLKSKKEEDDLPTDTE